MLSPIRRLSNAAPSLVLLALVLSACAPRTETAESNAQDATVTIVQDATSAGDTAPRAASGAPQEGADAPAVISQGELVELWMNLECASMENRCHAFVGSEGATAYVVLSIHGPFPNAAQRKVRTEDVLQRFGLRFNLTARHRARFPWLETVIIERDTADPFVNELARVSLVRTGDVTRYEDVYTRITWVQGKSFLPGFSKLEAIPLSTPWRN